MRIERLDLTRYGRFAGHTLDFGPSREGAPDLHVVYGPNEAGKSTLFAAWLDLLFGPVTNEKDGTPTKSYAFRHDLSTMQVGARIAAGGPAHDLVRTFGRTGLIEADGATPGEVADMLSASLRSLDRRAYRTMFSLDDRELEQGGNAVLASEGRLGELLFSSTAGLSHVGATLADAHKHAAALYRKGARRGAADPTELRAIEAEIERLDAEIADADTDAARMEAMVAERDAAKAAHEAADARWSDARAEMRRLECVARALEADGARREAEAAIAALGPLPPTPPDAAGAIDAVLVEGGRLADRRTALAARRSHVAERMDAITEDRAALDAAAAFDALDARPVGDDGEAASPRARMEGAEADLPRRESELAALDSALRDAVAAFGLAVEGEVAQAARAALPPVDAEAALRDLAARRSGLEARLANAGRELDEAMLAHDRASDAAGADEDAPSAEAIAEVERLVRLVRRRGSSAALRSAERALAGARASIASTLAAVGVGDAPLHAVAPPNAARLAEWRATADRLAAAARERSARLAGIDVERATLAAEASTIDVPAASDAGAARTARDAAWAAHREALAKGVDLDATAAAFENAMAKDDAVAARCLAALGATAARREKEAAIARLDAERAVLARDPDAGERDAFVRAVEGACEPLLAAGALTEASLDALEDHASRHAAAVTAHDRLAVLEGDVDLAREAEDRDAALVGEALAALGVAAEGASDEIAEIAETWHASAARALAQRERATGELARLREGLSRREREADDARDEDVAWRTAWSAALSRSRLPLAPPRDDAHPDCASVLGALDAARQIAAVLRERDGLAGRLRTMRSDRDAFLDRLEGICARLGVPESPWAERYAAARARIVAAREAAALTARLGEEAEAVEVETRALADGSAAHGRGVQRLRAALGTDDPDDMRGRLDAMIARDVATARRDEAERTIEREMGDAADLPETDRWTLAEARERLTAEEPALREAAGAAREAFALARDALERVGGDGRIARLNAERETLVVRMEEAARRALALSLGVRAAERALHRYRQAHRSAMLERASDAFAAMSCGAFSGLGVLPGDGDDVLHAVRPDGRHVEVPRAVGRARREGGLSTGTRNQLYLALRIAGYHELARTRTPPPFVCDDVLETFDDERAAATLRLFEDMAGQGQVVLLTHHAHLVDLARRTVPGVRCHDLAPARPALSIAAE